MNKKIFLLALSIFASSSFVATECTEASNEDIKNFCDALLDDVAQRMPIKTPEENAEIFNDLEATLKAVMAACIEEKTPAECISEIEFALNIVRESAFNTFGNLLKAKNFYKEHYPQETEKIELTERLSENLFDQLAQFDETFGTK